MKKIIRGQQTAFRVEAFEKDVLIYVCSPLPKHKFAPIVTSKNVQTIITCKKKDLKEIIELCDTWKDTKLNQRQIDFIFQHLMPPQ